LRKTVLLVRFLELLGRISANEEENQMSEKNLGVVLAPCLFQFKPVNAEAIDRFALMLNFVIEITGEARVHAESLNNYLRSLEAELHQRSL